MTTIYRDVYSFLELVKKTVMSLFLKPLRVKETFQQLYFVANGSLWIIVFCVCFAAVVTILESSFHMKLVIQNDSMVPGFASLLILRELGAVVTALLLTSRVGAGIAAEVGSMKVTEQIDALRMLGIDPIQFLLIPRLIATTLGCMILCVVANLICIFAAMIISDQVLGYTPSMFLTAMNRFVQFRDLIFSVVKAMFFGMTIPMISCFFGFRCKSGADGVGSATTQSVVFASISIIFLDFILSYTFSYFY
ncbi:MAG: ABC transporter permease [Bdellovibrionaceae bacterium]|nr:ABC transporter permease [Pseudobdellovibrionaceae bacterium]NUM59964.1 ABC transporter permease [Pseudobdellovibrionaceae bacterium]